MSQKININYRDIPGYYSVKSGSYAVVNGDIKMKMNIFGEYYPACDNVDALNDPNIKEICSMSNQSDDESVIGYDLFGNVENIKHDDILGYYSDLYAGYVVEGDYRKNASSGGMATWILKELLEKKYIDGVIHVKPADDGDGILFKYGISKTVEEISANSKSRYYPVEFSDVINMVKETEGSYAIVGIPSFITEIRLLAKFDPIVGQRIKFTIGLICGHQKSAKYAENLAWQCGIKPGNLKSIDFRLKDQNLPASDYSTRITGIIDGQERTIIRSQKDFFGSDWGHGFFKTNFSDYTDDAMNETADVSLGDAWLQPYVNDGLGNNIVITRNETISNIIKDGIADGKVKLDELSLERIISSQAGLIHHTRDELPYRLYKKDKQNLWRPKKRLAASSDVPFFKKRVQDLRQQIAYNSKIEYQKAVEKDDWDYFKKNMKKYVNQYKFTYKLIRLQKLGLSGSVKRLLKR